MFAIDEAHANAAGWISSRNTLLSGLFALLALLTHARSRAQQRPALRLASALCVGLALAAAEAGVAALAYLVAYALVFESGSWLERTRSVAPQLLVFSAWAVAYAALGCGMRGSSWYHELGDPLNLLREGSLDSPVWLFSLFGPSIVGYGAALTPNAVRLTALCLVVPVLVGLLFGLPRSRENRFFGLALLFCFPALLTTIPQERVTFAATFAAFGLIASLLAATRDSPRRALRWYRHGTVTVHFALAPLIFMVNLDTAKPVERGARAIARAVPKALPVDVVLVNVPVELLTMYAAVIAFPAVDPSAQLGIRALYAGGSALVAERTAPDTLEIRSELGWGSKPIERIFCAKRDLPQAGSERALAAMHVSVLETNREGSPTRVRFRFPTPLESPERQWLVWRGRGPTPWQPPALGQRVALPALSIASAL
jgi:hypothetical protein